jgi:hypothetical protein
MTITTTYMGAVIPSVLVTTGSQYATLNNAAMVVFDAHRHISGEGRQIPAAGLGIDGNVSWGGYQITALKSTTYTQQSSVTTANSLWWKTTGDLYATRADGTQVQITNGTALYSAGLSVAWSSLAVSSSPTIAATDTYTHYRVDTSAARNITLPDAATVGAGRYYVFQDVTGTAATYNITLTRAGSDTIEGATTATITAAYGWKILVSTGSGWVVLGQKFGGDLTGNTSSQQVTAITGTAGVATIRCDTLQFVATATTPLITMAANTTTAGVPLYIDGQIAGGSNQAGGIVHIAGGEPTGSGAAGGVRLAATVGGYQTCLTAGAFSATRRYVALHAAPVTTDIPTGDKVMYIANAATNPSSNPVGGGVLYVNAGALTYRGSSGTVTVLGAA